MCDVTPVTRVTVQEKRPRRRPAIFNAPQHCEYRCCCTVCSRSVVHDDGMSFGTAHAKNPTLNGWIGSDGPDDVWRELCSFDRPSPQTASMFYPNARPSPAFSLGRQLLLGSYHAHHAHLSDLITKIGQDGSPSRSLLPLLQEQALPEE